jgi:DNA polymerase III gamma/tau subunit
MRDALSLLDRLIAAGEKTLTSNLLEIAAGPARPRDRGHARRRDRGRRPGKVVLEQGAELLDKTSADQVLETFLDRFRDLMVLARAARRPNSSS